MPRWTADLDPSHWRADLVRDITQRTGGALGALGALLGTMVGTVEHPLTELVLPGSSGSHASTSEITLADASSFDVRFFGIGPWAEVANKGPVSQSATSNQAFQCRISASGGMVLRTGSTSGTTITTQTGRAPSPALVDGTLYGFRWVWTGTTTVRYYLADDPTDPVGTAWTQVGADVTITAPSMGGTSPVRIGAGQGGTQDFFAGSCRSVQIYKNGVLVASPDFTIQTAGATSFDDAQGITWTVNGSASIANQ